MKRTPAQASEARPMSSARIPHAPGAGRKTNAAKCTAIKIQPVSQIPENGVCPRRDTDAKAHANSATAAMSGSLVQSNAFTSCRKPTKINWKSTAGELAIALWWEARIKAKLT